jgi:hypothetical protein
MLPFASMGQSKSNEKSSTFTTGSGETVTINTNATVTQESNGTYDANVNRSITASGTTSAAGNINTTVVDNPSTNSVTANTTYISSQGASGTITSTIQGGIEETTLSGSEVSGSTTRDPGYVSKSYNTPEGNVDVLKGGGQMNITYPSGNVNKQIFGNGTETTTINGCPSGVEGCASFSLNRSIDDGVLTTTYSSTYGSATMTYSGTNNGSSGDSTKTITTSSGETVTINTNASGDDINKSITASGTTNAAGNINTTVDNGTATTTFISTSGVDETATKSSTTNAR